MRPEQRSPPRGERQPVRLRSRRVRHTENGLRSVPVGTTLAEIEGFFLGSGMEVQAHLLGRRPGRMGRAFLRYLSPAGRSKDRLTCGKGLSAGQAVASACVEFFERYCAGQRADDSLRRAAFDEIAGEAVDPRRFGLAAGAGFEPGRPIDWIRGTSLTRSTEVLVPANLVFCPYRLPRNVSPIAWTDSNGLAAGNNLEEAVLHGLLEVVERDAVMISEYNRLPFAGIAPEGLPDRCRPTLQLLERAGFEWRFMAGATDLPFPFVAASLRHRDRTADRAVAFGCDVDPASALTRALTEAVQVLPPSVNHAGWLRSGSPERYDRAPADVVRFADLKGSTGPDLRKTIEACVEILRSVGSEVLVVDLSLPEIPFPSVRVLVTGLQPIVHREDLRLSRRFFEVPVKLGLRKRPRRPASVKLWPLCGYR